MLRQATGNSDTQDSPQPGLGGSHHLPPYIILCSSPQGATSKWFFCLGTPKWESRNFPQLGLPQLWRRVTWLADLRLQWGVKQSCSPHQKLFNGMSHVTCTQGNWVNSRLLVVGSQTANLTLDPSSAHNLCFRCPNGQCEPISDIYASITFQWYKKLFETMNFDPCNRALKIWKYFWDSNSQHGSSLGSVRVHSLTLFALPRACEVTLKSPSWLATFQPFTLVASPRVGLRYIIIINRSGHKLQMCKKNGFMIFNLITHDNMIHLQNWVFFKFASPRHIIF